MKVCVTGAAGFLGRHVCAALEAHGHEVIGLDISHPASTVRFPWLVRDITHPLPPVPVDAVIHLAAVANPRESDLNPTKAFGVNVNGTYQVLKMTLESGARKVVFSSSAHVYDIPPKYLPTDEVHPLRLNNTYTTTKLLGEELCHLYFENHGLSYTTLRLYNAYGPGQALGYFIPDQIAKAGAGRIDLQGGNTTKDWVYVLDVARAFVLAVETAFVGPLNIGTGKETELADIACLIADATGATFRYTRLPNATRMCADIARARRVLGWEPTTSIEEGLHATLDHAEVAHPVLS